MVAHIEAKDIDLAADSMDKQVVEKPVEVDADPIKVALP